MLDQLDAEICQRLEGGPAKPRQSEKATARLASLVARGYCRFSRERSGPLGLYTGDVLICLTESGKEALHRHTANAQADLARDLSPGGTAPGYERAAP